MPRPTALSRLAPSLRGSAGLLSLLAAAGLILLPTAPAVRAQTTTARETTAAMAEEAARQAADRILTAVKSRDANAYFTLLAPDLQRVSSPAMAAKALQRLPQLQSWRISEVVPGLDSSSVTAQLTTSEGPREVLVVVDGKGRLEGYHVNATDAKAEDVVRAFMQALSNGYFVTASSFLSERVREEIPPSVLQRKWLTLQSLTGQFRSIRKISRAESNDQMKLVIVTTQFNRLTDNLFVVLDNQNQIINVDFPDSPNPPRAALR